MSQQVGLEIPRGRGVNRLRAMGRFAIMLIKVGKSVGMRVSSRGWCYLLEGFRLINKDQFDMVETLINECRKYGFLPIDFVAEEESRGFSGVEKPDDTDPIGYMKKYLRATLQCGDWYTPDWWDGEEYYIQMVVEKIDLKTLFKPLCEEYHIPIATAKGWSSMLQRAEYARRFREAEDKGLKCVLLYCGDHDPDGLRISEFLRSNLKELANIRWADGAKGYDPKDLKIDRFGLNFDFIKANNLTWIDNLITGSGKNLASPSHKNHDLQYVQDYLRDIGERKCEANALVVARAASEDLCRQAIEAYLGDDALDRFQEKRDTVLEELEEFREKSGVGKAVKDAIDLIDKERGT